MSAHLSPVRIIVAAIVAVIALSVAAGWDLATRGQLVVLHLGGHL